MKRLCCLVLLCSMTFGVPALAQRKGQRSKLVQIKRSKSKAGPCQLATVQGKVKIDDYECRLMATNQVEGSTFRFQQIKCGKLVLGTTKVRGRKKWTKGKLWKCMKSHQNTYKLVGHFKHYVSIRHSYTKVFGGHRQSYTSHHALRTYDTRTGKPVTLQQLFPKRYQALLRAAKKQVKVGRRFVAAKEKALDKAAKEEGIERGDGGSEENWKLKLSPLHKFFALSGKGAPKLVTFGYQIVRYSAEAIGANLTIKHKLVKVRVPKGKAK